ncbi:unnamed protein product [Ceutorhynchus assimilis]|uniref:RanBD1 domain-containing protein n=1 Tax=Ceutorhynchus assimilis TaxID=467358 RepID=A0A9N9QS40_9CUCU|nr:unnamed protein product [Ceutorhynchus assimilis]
MDEDNDKAKRLSSIQDNSGKILGGPKFQNPPPKFVLRPSGFNPFNKSTTDDNSKDDNTWRKRLNPFIPLESEKEAVTLQTSNATFAIKTSRPDVNFIPLTNTSTFGFAQDLQNNVMAGRSSEAGTSKYNTNSRTSKFVFGQNLNETVVKEVSDDIPPFKMRVIENKEDSKVVFGENVQEKIMTEGIFETASTSKESKSLAQSAREYEEAMAANKREYDLVEVKTGEEEERNILSMQCTLFAFENKDWQQRGRGDLRLNEYPLDDLLQYKCRLVVRVAGSKRVLLNTHVSADMTLESPNEKTIQLTARDSNDEFKIFLIKASVADTRQLFVHLKDRLNKKLAQRELKQRIADGLVEDYS